MKKRVKKKLCFRSFLSVECTIYYCYENLCLRFIKKKKRHIYRPTNSLNRSFFCCLLLNRSHKLKNFNIMKNVLSEGK